MVHFTVPISHRMIRVYSCHPQECPAMRFADVKGKPGPNKPALDYLRMRNLKIP